ncbi:MAG: histidine kinase [Acidobacteriota bacterium]
METHLVFSALLLFLGSLFCALLFAFSLTEGYSRIRRALIVLLGLLSVWYLGLMFVQLRFLNLLPWQPVWGGARGPSGRFLMFGGLARPGLLWIFTAIAHCYIMAVRQRGAYLATWIKPTRLYLCCFIATLIMRLGLPNNLNNYWLVAGAGLLGVMLPITIMFICYRALNRMAMEREQSGAVSQYSWIVCFGISFTLITIAFYRMTQTYIGLVGLYDVYAVISALPLIFWLIYYHTPYLFLDVLVKRGLQALFFALIFGCYFGGLAYTMGLLGKKPLLYYIGLAVAISLPAGMLTRMRGSMDRLIDLHLLGRAHFQDLLADLNTRLNSAANNEEAIAVASASVSQALGAASVEYYQTLAEDTQADVEKLSIAVSLAGESLGFLRIGSPIKRPRYLSEDLKFAQLAADSLAASLSRLRLQAEQQAQQIRELALVSTARELRLKALQAQLDPHFLFNSMNLISSLVRSAPDKARAAVQYLSQVYRYVLESSRRDLVTVADEIDFLRAYLEIEQLRFESRLRVKFNLCDRLNDVWLPPMLLQPLVENAIKHGLSSKIEGGELIISVQPQADSLLLAVTDTGVGFQANPQIDSKNGTGIGLANVRQQLALRYNVALEIESVPGRGTRVQFCLPLNMQCASTQIKEKLNHVSTRLDC